MGKFLVIALCGAAMVLAACNGGTNKAGAPLAVVEELPVPKLPGWIAEISPTEPAQTLAQVRVIFSKPITTVGSLGGDGPADVLSHMHIDPDLKGKFVVLTPRMIGFVPEQALPVGARVQITLTAGLHDLAGDTLAGDLAWTFTTDPVAFSDLPSLNANDDGSTPAPSGLSPTLTVTANAAVDPESLADHTSLSNGMETIPVNVKLEVQPTPFPGSGAQEAFDPSLRTWVYDITSRQTLAKATTYRIFINPGVTPVYGNLPSSKSFNGAIRTYAQLDITPTPVPSPGSASGRFANGDPTIVFDNPIDPKSLAGNVSIMDASGRDLMNAASKNATQSGTDTTSDYFRINDDAPNSIAVAPFQLMPDATYTVTVGANIKDIFGQTLGNPQNITIRTGDFTPGFWAPSGVNVFPKGVPVALNFYATNVPRNRYQTIFKPVTPTMLVNGDPNSQDFLPNSSTWPMHTIPGAKANVQSVITVPLHPGTIAFGTAAYLGEDNIPNFTGLVQLTNLGVFAQIFPTGMRILVQHLSDGTPVAGATVSLYRTGDTASTTPCATGTTDATGTLDMNASAASANARTVANALAVCYAGNRDPGEAPSVMVVASQGSDWTYTRVESWSGIYQYNVDGTWSNGQPLSRGTIFTDRQMYQPGESADVTGIAYYVHGGTIVADRNARYTVKLNDPDGNGKPLGLVQTDAHGIFSLRIPFGANQALGYYTVDAKGASGNEIFGELRVAEFKPPNFKLDLTIAHANSQASANAPAPANSPNTEVAASQVVGVAGSQVTADAQASYLFGAPVAGGTAKINVTRDIAPLAPAGWDEYSFGRQWFWPEEQPSFDTDVLQTNGTFDKAGSLTQNITVPSDLPFPMTYSVDIQASDLSNLTVDNTQTFTALARDRTIGLKSDLVGQSGQPLNVQAIVTALDGTVFSGQRMHIELQKMTYSSATQLVEGGEQPQNAVEYTTVDSVDVASGDQPVNVQLHPTDAGPYRVRADFQDAKPDANGNSASETDLQAFVVGAGEVNWGTQDTTTAQIKLDKKSYAIGDTATALITSPFSQSDVYVAIVRQNVIEKTLVHASGNGPKISFKVTPAMLPNVAVEALVVRRGPSLSTMKPGSLDSLSRIGVAALHVNLGDRYIKVSIQPQSATLEPSAHQNVAVQLHDAAGKTTRGEVVVMVVNDAILQLTGYRPPDLVQTIFADQPISTRFSDSRQQVILQTQSATAEKGWGYGGGFLAGAGSTRVRTNFQPIAYYRIVPTNANGRANVAFTLPDDLTTWRTMAVAIGDDDMHFGNADTTFIATKPLLTNPLLPQFARPGDTVDIGLSVLANSMFVSSTSTALPLTRTGSPTTSASSSTTDASAGGELSLTGQIGGPLTFAAGAPTVTTNASEIQETTTVGSTLQALRFPVLVGTAALGLSDSGISNTATVAFTSHLGSNSDAFRVSLPIRDRAVTESVIDSGVITAAQHVTPRGRQSASASSTNVPIDFSQGGHVQITVANSVVPQFAVPGAQAMATDPQPFVDDAASRLIVASALQQLAPRYHLKLGFDANKDGAAALAAIFKLQYSDGGFKSYPSENESDPFETAYAVEAMVFARNPLGGTSGHTAAFSVSPHILDNAKAYLARTLANPTRYSWCKDASCSARVRFEMLQALDALGDHRNDFLLDIVAQRNTFDAATQIRLTRYLLRTNGWKAQGTAMADEEMQTLYRTGRYSNANPSDAWSWLGSTVDAQSAMLQLLLQRKASDDEIDGAVRALLAQQCSCGWPTLDDTASAMQALSAYATTEKLVPFTASVTSSSGSGAASGSSGSEKTLVIANFGTAASSQNVTLDASSIQASQLVFNITNRANGGKLHYVVLYTYPIANNAPGQLAGLRVIRDVRPAGEATQVATMDLASLTDPIAVATGNVYDVGVRVIVDHPIDGVVIEDPIPAGMEAIDASFKTSSTAIIAQYDSWAIDDQEIYSDRVMAYASHLEPGIYEIHYLTRTVTPGEYRWPGSRAYLRNAPEQFGRAAAAVIKIE